MDSKEFSSLRQKLRKTQKQMAELFGTSLRAVQSFEQGWRKVPEHIERQALFLISNQRGTLRKFRPCWDIRSCSSEAREACPAWEFNLGHLCWFINGTICRGKTQGSWYQKIKVCRSCEVFTQAINPEDREEERSRFRQEGRRNG